jgi:hypothetical protein
MQLFSTPEAARAALRGLKTVAMANGVFDAHERALLGAAAQLYGEEIKDPTPSISGAELARAIPAPEERLKALDDCVLMALADEEATAEEWRVLGEFGAALGVGDERLRQGYDLALEQRRLAQHELQRRQLAEILRELYAAKGQAGLAPFFKSPSGRAAEDPAISWRYRRLGLLPKNTLGRELWRYCRAHDFGLPGETGGLPEDVLYHDLLHVLAGYGTDPDGELALGAFIAGMTRRPPFPYLFFVLLSFKDELSLSPKKLAKALARGQAARDLTRGWDFFAVIERPLDELRAEYGIQPL